MGIARGAYRLLLDEKKRGTLEGKSLLQLGRQCVLFGEKTLHHYARLHHVNLTPCVTQLSFNSTCRKKEYIDDETLFKALGFTTIQSLDFSDFEGADIVWDLNYPIPEKYWNRFDVIYDGGTTEHVFNFPQVLKNIHLMLKEGGVIVHDSPSNHHVDHGFYMFSPQVYSEYYAINRYEILTSNLIEYSPNPARTWSIYSYCPGALEHLNYGNYGKNMVLIHLMARKSALSTMGEIPQQGTYLKAWNAAAIGRENSSLPRKYTPLSRLKISLEKKINRHAPLFFKRYINKKKLNKIAEY